MVLTWPPIAARCRALRPCYRKELTTSEHKTGTGMEVCMDFVCTYEE